MKITPKQYAVALYESINGDKNKIKLVLNEFVKVLILNNDIIKAPKIILEFEKIWDKKKGIVTAEIISAGELEKSIIKLLNNYIKKVSEAEQVISRQAVDKNLLGGVVVKYGDKIIDASLRTRLVNLKEEMVK